MLSGLFNHEFILRMHLGCSPDKTGRHCQNKHLNLCINTDAVLFGATDPKYDSNLKLKPVEQGF
jgi:3-isopropylmalate dehydrogenase